MDADDFDALSRSLGDARSRRGSLAALGSLALVASQMAPGVTAAKRGKHKGKGSRKCTPQDGQCRAALPGLCAAAVSSSSVDECVSLLEPCCAFFHDCKLPEAFACARDVIAANR